MSDIKPRVHGPGGVFFKREGPQQPAAWYARHLGVGTEGWGGHLIELWQPNPDEPSLQAG